MAKFRYILNILYPFLDKSRTDTAENIVKEETFAKATGKEVHAGPGEATAIGNITAQMLKAGDFKSVEEARTTIHESFGIKIYK